MRKKLHKILSYEVGIEFKACLYFAIILFYYFIFCILQGSYYASIVLMVEMVLTTYAMGYIQVYLMGNFDEAERFDRKTAFATLFCSAVYAAISYGLDWFGRNSAVTAGFFFYMLLVYGCVFLCYKIKRDVDTVQLNRELADFKRQKNCMKA
ncbi:MAG: DUF3021 domain-containing protein [Blautia sp.]|nr:DUF3021 domain-containing protein [Lachnoclostridium sp.]MCM1212404.1 DUF3021 domain-containing protein [Blautia sp.]